MKKNGEYVGVDEKYVPEDEKYVDESLLGNKEESKEKIKKVAKGIGIGYLIYVLIVVLIIVGIFIFAGKFLFKAGKTFDNVAGKATNLIDNVSAQTENIGNMVNKKSDSVSLQTEDIMNKQSVNLFNFDYDNLQGEHMGADYRLDKIITNNKTNSEHIITVVYMDKSAITEDEILSIKKSLNESTKYYYSVDYDSDGYVNKVTIKK